VQTGTHEALVQRDGLYRDLASYQFRVPEEAVES
jgi:ABC-type multidrug transport system fused ATPase/permease subunit